MKININMGTILDIHINMNNMNMIIIITKESNNLKNHLKNCFDILVAGIMKPLKLK